MVMPKETSKYHPGESSSSLMLTYIARDTIASLKIVQRMSVKRQAKDLAHLVCFKCELTRMMKCSRANPRINPCSKHKLPSALALVHSRTSPIKLTKKLSFDRDRRRYMVQSLSEQ